MFIACSYIHFFACVCVYFFFLGTRPYRIRIIFRQIYLTHGQDPNSYEYSWSEWTWSNDNKEEYSLQKWGHISLVSYSEPPLLFFFIEEGLLLLCREYSIFQAFLTEWLPSYCYSELYTKYWTTFVATQLGCICAFFFFYAKWIPGRFYSIFWCWIRSLSVTGTM